MPSSALPAAPVPLMREPLHDGGRVALGPALDGTGHTYYPLAGPRRLRHGLIVGDAGAGVSNLATVLAVTARAAMPLVTVYVNGHNRLTNPALADQASVLVAGEDVAETARTTVAALERAVDARAALLAAMRAASYPAAGLPGLLVVLKDAHRVFAGHGERWAQVARQAGVLGIGVLALVRDLELGSFGGCPALRTLLLDQVVALRTRCAAADLPASAQGAQGAAVLGEGRLFSADPAARHEDRAFAPFRLAAGGTDELVERGRRRWLAAYPDTALDAPTRTAFAGLAGRDGAA
jgi:hypothetical protein